ncbi:hypothetical protein K458DRAFT_80047 [Lentithecium fluviatile CBS 122367]|uniref:Uncharacterized protein n=1 Tax=Lentithecium fluviatile CBS 122367 TaxID=1168545 RepID=A0A6G1ITT3_9PLEO|nr:hypothetical protein K458DRAFT_80047 [Lentithecium fluviatile CBS 122367]
MTNDDDPIEGKIWTLAQPKAYIKDFIREGFPPPTAGFPRWVPPDERYHPTRFYEGLNNHGAHLKGGIAIVMHPKVYERGDDLPPEKEGEPPIEQYVEGEGPQHPDNLNLLRKTVDGVMKKNHKSTVNWWEDYLYLPARETPDYERAYSTASGRSVFEYDPDFDLGNGKKTKMGMLLLEDGGPRGQQNEDGTYEPGPGGPFCFDFG